MFWSPFQRSQFRGANNGTRLTNRVDRSDLEPRQWLLRPLTGMYELLRNANGPQAYFNGAGKIRGTTRITGGRAKWTGAIKFDERALELPKRWKQGRLIFVNSMSDLFHDNVPFDFIELVFDVMASTPQHTYQVLTKRAERLKDLSARLLWPPNVWMGVSVEKEDYWFRVECLRDVTAHVRFLSLEPLLGPLRSLDFRGIHWVIAGGESGPKARPLQAEWVRAIRDACIEQDVPFHFKQWGGVNKKATGRILDNRTWDQLPAQRFRLTRASQLYGGRD
jgi:protein gp37